MTSASKQEKYDWHLYIIRCSNGDLYTGISTNVHRRLEQHMNNKGAQRLKGHGPLKLVYEQFIGSYSKALRIEYKIKKLKKENKEKLKKEEIKISNLFEK